MNSLVSGAYSWCGIPGVPMKGFLLLLAAAAASCLFAAGAVAGVPDVGPTGELAAGASDGKRGPRIHMPTNDPFQPYRTVTACPRGTKAQVVDWPQPGDMSCEPTDEDVPPAPGTDYPKLLIRTADVGAPYREVERCPRGTRPIAHGGKDHTVMLCDRDHSVKDWSAEPAGDGPRTSIPTDDPFKPYRSVSACPPDQVPYLTDWPRPGDMACMRVSPARR